MSTFTDALDEMGEGASKLEDAWRQALQASGHLSDAADTIGNAARGTEQSSPKNSIEWVTKGHARLRSAIVDAVKASEAINSYLNQFDRGTRPLVIHDEWSEAPPMGSELLEAPTDDPRTVFRKSNEEMSRKMDKAASLAKKGTEVAQNCIKIKHPKLKPPIVTNTTTQSPQHEIPTIANPEQPLNIDQVTTALTMSAIGLIRLSELAHDRIKKWRKGRQS